MFSSLSDAEIDCKMKQLLANGNKMVITARQHHHKINQNYVEVKRVHFDATKTDDSEPVAQCLDVVEELSNEKDEQIKCENDGTSMDGAVVDDQEMTKENIEIDFISTIKNERFTPEQRERIEQIKRSRRAELQAKLMANMKQQNLTFRGELKQQI